MDFGADLVYLGHSGDESASEEELQAGLLELASRQATTVDDDDGSESPLAALRSAVAFPSGGPPPPPAPGPPAPGPVPSASGTVKAKKEKKRVKWRRQDTNVVSLSLGTLASTVTLLTGDPRSCRGCGAFVNIHSKLTPVGAAAGAGPAAAGAPEVPEGATEDTKAWRCEFCGVEQTIELPAEEAPTAESGDYVIEAAAGATTEDAHNVVFCVDTSGSMCVTSELRGRIALRGAEKRREEFQSMRQFGDGSDQFMPGQARDTTYVSRLQCVQAAVDSQLESLERDSPNVTCSLVAFSSDVKLIGDGTQAEVTIAGDKLNNQEECVAAGEAYRCEHPVRDARGALSSKVFALEESGATALGPALLAAVSLAGSKPASKVVICTDGVSNVGVGAIDAIKTDEERERVAGFYDGVGELARRKGVNVSVVSIEGENCSMENLGRVADLTGGQVDIVKPVDLTKNFGTILADRVIATNVRVVFLLHAGLRFREEEGGALGSRLERDVGNVTASTDVMFEYSILSDAELAALPNPPAPESSLPFQVQIHFTRLDGMKCVRVLTQTKHVTTDRDVAEKSANMAVLGAHNMQQSARLVAQGEYTEARKKSHAAQRLFGRASKTREQQAQYVSWVQKTEELDRFVREEQNEERMEGRALSDDEADAVDAGMRATRKKAKSNFRASKRTDSSARVMYQAKAASKSLFSG